MNTITDSATKKNSLSSSLSRLMPENVSSNNQPASYSMNGSTNTESGSSIINYFANITCFGAFGYQYLCLFSKSN